ncbi:DPBB and LysM peptidoglycan-binding domain-containing protein [Flammeovirga kamogawensis]|uniref:LysM peptidoglycan-binding domain-containing protein n=1 Tax=Flammeovirga kamogawensis TaxID=373891 RepID=A0ABX8GU69_9BACT|nr:LysM peptidoglycan-binding domain-containing protein [Flammeovirga kamogawensis]MBB6459886.1 LysM repeat protein [Flammeovirga kamogawensis]QWG07061.1 LysM peptidoglycan-binding domain-containing protein [Flammeovirga kamogawensis]TRX68882.1 LysM peptidoglycan-binding domain-containing protein [Flammeovirga kamogawensis]
MRVLLFFLYFFILPIVATYAQTTVSHEVQDQETLFSISRKYNVSVKEIVDANNIQNNVIKIGQVLTIPQKGAEEDPYNVPATEVIPAIKITPAQDVVIKEAIYYSAQDGETLRQVAYIYQVPVDSLAVWNGFLPDQMLVENQQIVVSLTGEVNKVDETAKKVQSKSYADLTVQEAEDYDIPMQKVERGNGIIVDLPNNTSKLMALHRKETIGSYIKVINPNNDKEAIVRVVAALPDQSIADGVIIKISEQVAKKIGVVNEEFRVRVEYNQ